MTRIENATRIAASFVAAIVFAGLFVGAAVPVLPIA